MELHQYETQADSLGSIDRNVETEPYRSTSEEVATELGLLALQVALVDRSSMAVALRQWAVEPSRPLDRLLVDRGLVDADAIDRLEQMIDRSRRGLNGNGRSAPLDSRPVADEGPAEADPFCTRAPTPGEGFSISSARFRPLRPLAEGGLGRLSVARDLELNREVALKEIKERHADDERSRDKFVLEAEVTGGLDHPGIVPVYSLGRHADGRPYYAMRLIRGETLDAVIRRIFETYKGRPDRAAARHSLGLRKLLGHIIDACYAVEYAHTRGVLHRDIKPENIMIGKFGETLVVDWGLAKPRSWGSGSENRTTPQGSEPAAAAGSWMVEEPSSEPLIAPSSSGGGSHETPGAALGTPAYMPPEQAIGRLDRLGPWSDVFSLGASLYHALTGRAPYIGSDLGEILRAAARAEFPDPRTIVPALPRDLGSICLKAMSKRPEDRYATPRALAEDLEHWQADEPIAAHRDSPVGQLARWGRHHRSWVAAGVLAALVVGVVATVAAFANGRAAASAREARLEALQSAGRYAARTLGEEIGQTWLVLQDQADDPGLRDALTHAVDSGQTGRDRSLQAWVEAQDRKYGRVIDVASWTVTDRNGWQRARAPEGGSIGKNYAFRTYFHGGPVDLDHARAERSPAPIRGPHQSPVYRSEASGLYSVTFTAPIWEGEPGGSEVLGVLGLTIQLGHFHALEDEGRVGQVTALLNLPAATDVPLFGLVLHHPTLDPALDADPNAPRPPEVRLPTDQAKALRRKLNEAEAAHPRSAGLLATDYDDPTASVDPSNAGPWLAALVPVRAPRPNSGTGELIEAVTGWVVVVQGRPDGGE